MVPKIILIAGSIIGYVSIIIAASYASRKAMKINGLTMKKLKQEIPNGILIRGLMSLIYYFCIIDWIFNLNLIKWSYIQFPVFVNYSGLGLLALMNILFWWIHIVLGENYHGPNHLHENHKLIKSGPYLRMRHPTYFAFILLHFSYFMITNNWIILVSGQIMSSIVNYYRIIREENLLVERFGDEYQEYRKRTWSVFPKIF